MKQDIIRLMMHRDLGTKLEVLMTLSYHPEWGYHLNGKRFATVNGQRYMTSSMDWDYGSKRSIPPLADLKWRVETLAKYGFEFAYDDGRYSEPFEMAHGEISLMEALDDLELPRGMKAALREVGIITILDAVKAGRKKLDELGFVEANVSILGDIIQRNYGTTLK